MIKRSFYLFFLVCFMLIFITSCDSGKNVTRNSHVQQLASQISEKNLRKTIADLVNFGTRFPYHKQIAVADYLYGQLKQRLKTTVFHKYEYWGVEWKNVVGTIVGNKFPNEVVIVCAHMDSKSPKRLVLAPGADDNGSGCAAVLELARILSGHSFDRTIKFILFSREESGQNGSKAYLRDFDVTRQKIIAALNIDMIAYGDDFETLDLVTRPKYRWLADDVYNFARTYDLRVTKVVKKGCA